MMSGGSQACAEAWVQRELHESISKGFPIFRVHYEARLIGHDQLAARARIP
jgi:hypothetical protein